MIRPAMKGPRSLSRIVTDLPFVRFVTLTLQGSGRVLWAPLTSKRPTFSPSEESPLLKPKKLLSSYHEAIPVSS